MQNVRSEDSTGNSFYKWSSIPTMCSNGIAYFESFVTVN